MDFRLSARADRDLVAIFSYVAKDDRVAARNLVIRIQDRLAYLSRFPELGRSRSDIATDVRGLLISPYVALYRIRFGEIVVLRILHTSRDLGEVPLS